MVTVPMDLITYKSIQKKNSVFALWVGEGGQVAAKLWCHVRSGE